jgi:hypothetical protein
VGLTSRARAFPVLFELADCPPAPCGLSARRQFIPVRRDVLCVLVLIRFCFSFRCSWFADGPSFSSGRSRSRADGLPGLRGRSVFSVHFWWFCWLLWTVRGSWPDCPRLLAGLSARPLWTVRPSWPDSPPVPGSFAPWFDSSLLSFVLPRVLQGIVPKT